MQKERFLKYDIIRIVAIFLVIMCHVSAFLVLKFPDTTTLEFQMGNIPNGICRACIPLFVMLSGALLLNENKKFSTKEFYKHSLLWMVLLLVGWLLVYALFYSVILPSMMGEAIDGKNFISYILTFKGSDYPHLWYMFMVIGLYLMTPVFRLFVKKENVKYIIGIIVASIIYSSIAKTMDVFVRDGEITITKFMSKFHMEGLLGYTSYFLLGWLFDNFEVKKPWRYVIYGLGVLSVVSQTIIVQCFYNEIETIRNYTAADTTIFTFVYGAAVYLLINTLCGDRTHTSKFIATLSNITYGTYMIHVVILEIFTRVLLTYEKCNIHPMLYFLMQYVITLVLSFLISFLISKIKYVRKIIHIK